MGYCLAHNQNYDERSGGFCYQCKEAANIKVVSTTSTNSESEKCQHANFERRQVMDFSYNHCRDCGREWRC